MGLRCWDGLAKAIGTSLGLAVIGATSIAHADLYGHWPLNDGEGDEAVNLVEGGATGLIFDFDHPNSLGGTEDEPSVWVNDPDRGTVLGLNGDTQWVEAGFIPKMTLENDFTWAFHARVPPGQASPNNDIVLGNRWGENGADTSPREFIKFTTNRFEYHMNTGFGDDLAYADSNQPLDEWVYNSVVKDGDSLTYYRNGELRNSTTISGGQISGEPLTLGFGADPLTGAEAWRGSLSDVQLYTSALSPAQITTAMGGTIVGDAELYAHYPLNDSGADNDNDITVGTGPGAVPGGALIENLDAGLGVDGNHWLDDPERGTVLSFAGTYVDAGELPVMDLENDFSWNFWSKADGGQAQTDSNIIMGNVANGDGEFIQFTNNKVEFRADGTDASDLEWGAAGENDNKMPNDDQWYHHTVVKEGDQMRYYRNGQLSNEVNLGLGQQSEDELPFAMGGQEAFNTPGRETAMVYLSDVRLYTNTLTQAEIAALAGVDVSTCNDATGGDLDGNGKVEFADFLVLSGNFGKDVDSHVEGDIDCNGKVEFADFLTLSGNFGKEVGGAQSVPEPSTFALLGTCLVGLGCFRRRRR